MATGFVWPERYAWHDARGLLDTFDRSALFEPEPSLENGTTKRRLRNLVDASGLLDRLVKIQPRPATEVELARGHGREYTNRIRSASSGLGGDAGGSTPFGRWTYEIAALAAGGCLAAVDAVIEGRVQNAYALVRPPGHHAGPRGGCGYCVFNNIAVAVHHLRHSHDLERVAIVDWDVHHGNGTQETFWSDPTVLSISVHQEDLFPPASGLVGDVGQRDGTGANINIPLPAGAGRAAYLDVLDRVVVPALERFAPEFILVACGFDAAMLDPLGRMNLTSECFAMMTARMAVIAASICQSRLVLCHEGGYSSSYVPYCGLAVIESLAGVRTDVIDPWLTDARRVRELPLRADERAAIKQAIAHAGL